MSIMYINIIIKKTKSPSINKKTVIFVRNRFNDNAKLNGY